MTALLAEAVAHRAARADGVEVSWATPDAVEQSMPLSGAWSMPFECGLPVRRFTARKGQRHLSGLWWCATTAGHVGFESWLETDTFSAARLFAAIYPEAVDLAQLIASPAWRSLASGDADQQERFVNEVGRRLDRPDYQPPQYGDAIAHWMTYDSWRAPSRPHTTFPDTRQHRSGAPAKTSTQSLERHHRGALWFAVNRRGGTVVLHHRHIRPVLIRDWSRPMDGITATIWASRTTSHPVDNRMTRP